LTYFNDFYIILNKKPFFGRILIHSTTSLMPTDVVEKSFCTTREAAQLLGVSVGTVQLWVESGLLEAWKTAGGHRRVIRASLDKLIRQPTGVTWAAAAVPDSAPTRDTPLSVMVVEDEPTLLRLYQVKIGNWPMRPSLVVVDNAFDALLTMGRSAPDLLITDLQMPGIDGFKMLRAIHAAPKMEGTTIVVVSGLDAIAIEKQGGIPPGIDVLQKPIPFEQLQSIAQDIVRRKQLPIGK
jgi:excisionase family DNA binding protein